MEVILELGNEENDGKSLDCLQTVNRNMGANDSASEDSEGRKHI